ncbi:hypothetical protein M2318_001694 [Metapseudomonas resinovorans]|uniref:hypothetical protein n=1 Tax=Metapseudomonas resinovorans TaxID=53412 RepID=UPI003D1B9472
MLVAAMSLALPVIRRTAAESKFAVNLMHINLAWLGWQHVLPIQGSANLQLRVLAG